MKLKDHVLAKLLSTQNGFCSGTELAKEFHVSRTAVWKVIEQLKSEGCEIQAVTNRGYRLVSAPDLFSPIYLEQLLSVCRTKWSIHYFPEIDSTNTYAKRMASRGAPAGLVVIADRQTAGKGRLGKSFHSPTGGLYMTIVLRPELPLSDMMAVTACTASAIHLALKDLGITAQIKWVNDLFLNGRKICGILTEGSFNAELLSMDFLVIGIGLNVRPDPNLPEELRPIVTDLLTESGKQITRCELAAGILTHFEQLMEGLPDHSYLSVYTDNSCTLGHHVHVKAARGECDALAVGFAEDAGLIVEHPDGTRETIRTGTAVLLD